MPCWFHIELEIPFTTRSSLSYLCSARIRVYNHTSVSLNIYFQYELDRSCMQFTQPLP